METYASDDEQAEAVKKWWRENGKSVIAGAVLGIGAVLGWQQWQAHVTTQSEKASALQRELIGAQGEAADAKAAQLMSEYERTPYAALAALTLAKRAVEAGEFDAAKEKLRWAMEHATLPEMRGVARVRLARVLVQTGQADEALSLLAEGDGFTAAAAEVRGDIHLARGEREEALEAYRRALDAGANRATLQMKIDELGG